MQRCVLFFTSFHDIRSHSDDLVIVVFLVSAVVYFASWAGQGEHRVTKGLTCLEKNDYSPFLMDALPPQNLTSILSPWPYSSARDVR